MKTKTIAIIAIAAALTSCAGVSVVSPWGTATTDAKGNLIVVPTARPIVIPTK